MMLIAGRANRPLAEKIAAELDTPICDVDIRDFSDGEIFVRINENVRGRDVYIVQPTSSPADNVVELLLLIDAARRASAARVTAVVPYFGYARQDRKDQPRVPISAKLMANLIVTAGADRLLGIDFHQHQLQGFFDIPIDHLYAAPVLLEHFRSLGLDDLAVVAPDVGAAKMARGFARRLDATLAIIDKRRPAPNEAEILTVVGEVRGRTCLVVDDMIDTAGTVVQCVQALKEEGAAEVYCGATHAVFSGAAVQRLAASPAREVTVTDTILIPEAKRFPALRVLSVAPLLAKAIYYTHVNESVSSLFE
ncbi:MAG: ribose-phosphate pyrophosphokinase [Gemmatimonadetes bacterium]|nr:ribose-phosphate pyrophosphokinase [Gemmatimonadota bacterium]